MASISSPGIGSGLDVNGLITKLMAVESQPLVQLNQKEAGLQAQLSAYGNLKGALASFQSTMQALSALASYQGLKASSADTSVYTATANTTAVPGNYAVEVRQLAQADKLISGTFTNTTDTVGTGTLTIQFGTWSGGTFSTNSAKGTQSVTIDSAHSSLAGVRDAINNAKIGVTATILNDGSGNRLVLTANDTGAANSLKIAVADTSDASNTDNNGLSQLAYDPAGTAGNGKNLTETVAAQNALLTVDGLNTISKASNIVSDVIQGVTLTLVQKSATGVATALSVTRDTASVQTAVQNFVKAYNDLSKTEQDLTGYDPATKKGGVLQGDYSALTVINQIQRVLNNPLAGPTGSLSVLSQIGVAFQKDGTLALDNTKLQVALDSNYGDIAGLFANVGKPSDSLINFVSATDQTPPGSFAVNVSQLATRGLYTGSTTASLAETVTPGTFDSPVVIDSTNNTFGISLNGVQSGAITLTQGSYTTTAALIAEIQSRINGDASLKTAGVTATVSFDSVNDRIVITSDQYGSASVVNVTSVGSTTTATLGLSVANGTTGVDVAGTINGIAALGTGRSLTAPNGLKIDILGGATGSRGTIRYTQGYAYQLSQLANQLLANNGPITSRTDGINQSIKDIGGQRDRLNLRLADIQANYQKQFTALDALISQMNSTSSYLTQQLASLPTASISAKG